MAICLMIPLAVAGCATPGNGPAPSPDPVPSAPGEVFGRVSFSHEEGTLGDAVRAAGDECGGGLVAMNGVEDLAVGSIRLHMNQYEQLVRRLVEETGLDAQQTPHYYFLYPPGYEEIAALDVSNRLDPAFTGFSAGSSFGAGTQLFNVFAVLSQNLGITLLADNVVAEELSGELFLEQAPLPQTLNAVLKSARVHPAMVQVESTPDYIFVHGGNSVPAGGALLNAGSLPPGGRELLARRVTVYLPERPMEEGKVTLYRAARRLETVLRPLSEQLGVPVRAEAALMDLPVNLTVFNDVPVGVVLDLLVRQWPLPEFGYELRENGVFIRQR